jgi:hypothetical protein
MTLKFIYIKLFSYSSSMFIWYENVSFVVPQRNMAYLKVKAIHPTWPKRMTRPSLFVLFYFFLPFELAEPPSMARGMVRPPPKYAQMVREGIGYFHLAIWW